MKRSGEYYEKEALLLKIVTQRERAAVQFTLLEKSRDTEMEWTMCLAYSLAIVK